MIPAELKDPRTGDYTLPWQVVFKKYDPELHAKFSAWQKAYRNLKELDKKTYELIIVAIDSLVAWPSPYIDVHIHGAFDAGASIQEVIEAITVAAIFGGGHAYNHGLVAMEKTIRERTVGGAPTPRRRRKASAARKKRRA